MSSERNLSASDIEAALRNPGELMGHVGMWVAHSAPMVGPVMEAIARRAPEEFLTHIKCLTGVLPDGDVKAWLQLAIHALAQEAHWSTLLQYADVARSHFGNGATAVILSMATRHLPESRVFDESFLRKLKEWRLTDSEICTVLQPALCASAGQARGRLKLLVDDVLGAGLSAHLFAIPEATTIFHAGPAASEGQVAPDIYELSARDPKAALNHLALGCAALQGSDVLRLAAHLCARLSLEEIFDARLLKVLRDKALPEKDVATLLCDAIKAVPPETPMPLEDILFFSPAWTPFLSASVIAEVIRLLKTRLPEDVMWFKEHLSSSLTDEDSREIFGDDEPEPQAESD
jgi:hypothetical protein